MKNAVCRAKYVELRLLNDSYTNLNWFSFLLYFGDKFMDKRKEYFYQFLLFVLLFILTVYDEENWQFQWGYLLLGSDFMIASVIVNYVFLPRYYYKKRFSRFWIYSFLITSMVVFVEELIWEPLFFDYSFHDHDGISEILYSYTSAIPGMAILVGFKFTLDAGKHRAELDRLKQLMIENKMQILKAQINPHFLFNNLNNLYSFAIENSKKTPVIIHKLSLVLRYMLYDCHEKYVPLENEIEHIDNFIQLNELQIEERGIIQFKCSRISGKYKVAPLLLIVFVENAFKHSLSSLVSGIKIFVDIKQEGSILYFKCENNYSPEDNLKALSRGIGLENAKSQLKMLYPESHKLTILKDENTYTVDLVIDLKNLPDDKSDCYRRSTGGTASVKKVH